MDYSHISSCRDVDEEVFASASLKRGSSLKLLARLCDICTPDSGEEHLMVFVARIAMRDWLKGCVRLDIHRLADGLNVLILACEEGSEAAELVFEREFRSSFGRLKLISEDAAAILPFAVYESTVQHLSLEALRFKRASTVPPAPFLDASARLSDKLSLSYESVYTSAEDDPEGTAVTQKRFVAQPLDAVLESRHALTSRGLSADDLDSDWT